MVRFQFHGSPLLLDGILIAVHGCVAVCERIEIFRVFWGKTACLSAEEKSLLFASFGVNNYPCECVASICECIGKRSEITGFGSFY